MRKLIFSLLVLAIAGCCKVYCDGTELVVSFEKFSAAETDSVYFFSYVPATGLTQRVDSFLLTAPPAPTAARSSVTHSISSSFNWKIVLPSANRQYFIQNFELTTEKCNCGGKRYKSIRRFTVNGTAKEGLYLSLE